MPQVVSPVTQSPAVHILDLDRAAILKAYMNELSLHVENYFPENVKISLYQCPDTGYRFYYPFTIFADAEFYRHLNASNANYYEDWKWENEEAFKFITKDETLLDVGCGDGLFLKELNKRGMKNLYGIDFASKEAGKAGDIHIENSTIEQFSLTNKEKFDVITCFQVLEHIAGVKQFLDACLTCLKPGGRLIFAVPNNTPFIYKRDVYHTLNLPPHHAGLWNKQSLEKLQKYFPLIWVYHAFQPIGSQLEYYIHVQIAHHFNNNKFMRYLFGISLFRNSYARFLRLKRKTFMGHTILVVFRKK